MPKVPPPNFPTNIPTREYHPATVHRAATPAKGRKASVPHVKLPKNKNTVDVEMGDVYEAILTTERDGGFRTLLRERKEAIAGAAAENDCQQFCVRGHELIFARGKPLQPEERTPEEVASG